MTLSPYIDEDACLAHGDCALVAPGVFTVTDIAEVTGTRARRRPAQGRARLPRGRHRPARRRHRRGG